MTENKPEKKGKKNRDKNEEICDGGKWANEKANKSEWHIMTILKLNTLLLKISQMYREYATEYSFLEGCEETLDMLEDNKNGEQSM
eukprot:6841982-Ditylum_brightwellii.AAC.2